MTVLELIQEIREGRDDRRAREELYIRVRSALLERIAAKIPARLRSRLDGEDALHDAYLRAMKALGKFQPRTERSFFSWVYRIAKNRICDAGARHSAWMEHFAEDRGEAGPRASQVLIPGGTTRTEGFRIREWCGWILDRLGPRERAVLKLRDMEGRSYEEIAEAWGVTPAAVRQCHHRAVERAKEIAARERK